MSNMTAAKHIFSRLLLSAALSFAVGNSFAAAESTKVELDTTAGKIVLELNNEKAPKTVENFVKYVKSGHYAGTVFHRVIKDFMIQGGGMDANLKEKPTMSPVKNEGGNGLSNKKYTIAMARTPDPDSATSQFFINSKDNLFLDRAQSQDGFGYAVFGVVIEGKEVVDKIEAVKTGAKADPRGIPMRDVPVEPIVITKASVVE
ncbi:peptidylprolyl isomerase [Rhodopirellula sp.]|jgi:cyclophilin family peptidyl-prolyl cis-trans isomerase|nr:peptidylprolyl isomerase [Rhodopirellula sp.]